MGPPLELQHWHHHRGTYPDKRGSEIVDRLLMLRVETVGMLTDDVMVAMKYETPANAHWKLGPEDIKGIQLTVLPSG